MAGVAWINVPQAIWTPFWAHVGTKICKNLFKNWLHLLIPFLKVLELFRCLLAVFLAIPRLSWTALDPKNLEKLQVFRGLCKCTILGTREVMLAFLGASWRSWADSGLKLAPKMTPKLVQNLFEK